MGEGFILPTIILGVITLLTLSIILAEVAGNKRNLTNSFVSDTTLDGQPADTLYLIYEPEDNEFFVLGHDPDDPLQFIPLDREWRRNLHFIRTIND